MRKVLFLENKTTIAYRHFHGYSLSFRKAFKAIKSKAIMAHRPVIELDILFKYS